MTNNRKAFTNNNIYANILDLHGLIKTYQQYQKHNLFITPFTKKIFHTDGCAGAIILLGLVGGFPIGAKGVVTLYEEKKLDLKAAQAVTMFLVGGGPGFIVSVIGVAMYRDVRTGFIIWGCQLAAQIFLGIFSCRKLVYTPVTENNADYQKQKSPLGKFIQKKGHAK